jgi:uncharacterized protein
VQSEIEGPKPETDGPKPASRIWEGWPTVGFGVAIFFIYLVVQNLVALVISVIFAVNKYASNPLFDIQQFLQFIMGLSSNGLLISIAVIVSAVAGIGFIILFIKIRKGATIKEYLALKPISKKTVLSILGIIVGLIIFSGILDAFFPQTKNNAFAIDTYKTSVWPALFGISVVIFAPAFEEGFFRGFLFAGLKQSRLGPTGTIILTAVAWALPHLQYNLVGMATILVLGLVFGIVRLKTGSLWSTLLLHSVWNLAAIIGTVLYVNGVGS